MAQQTRSVEEINLDDDDLKIEIALPSDDLVNLEPSKPLKNYWTPREHNRFVEGLRLYGKHW